MTNPPRKKVLYIVTKSGLGGASRYVLDLAVNLPKETYDVAVAFGEAGPLKTALDAAGIRTISLPCLQRDISIFKEFVVFFTLVKLYRQERPGIVHLNSSKVGGLGSLAARLANVPRIIFTAHGWYFLEDRSALIRTITWILSFLTQLFAHTTIVLSESERRRSPIPSRAVVVHNGRTPPDFLSRQVAQKKLLECAKVARLADRMTWIGTLAELHQNKGLSYLINACAEMPDIALFILGEGEERDRLSSLIVHRNLEDRVFLLGNIPEGARFLSAFDIFVLPSTKEGFPYALLEAGAAGLPTIATRVGGIPELIEDGKSGILVEPKKQNQLQRALAQLSSDRALREHLGAAFQNRIHNRFTLQEMLRNTRAVYES